MPRDYAPRNRNQKRPAKRSHARGKQGLPGWLWMVVGLSIGLVVAAIVYIGRPTGEPAATPVVRTEATAAAPASAARSQSPPLPPKEKPRFSFYELLPSYEVVVPEATDKTVGGKPGAVPVVPPGQYVIQVGSFRSSGEAESQKAKLALLGIESRVESVTIDNRDTWYRVRVGPIDDPKKVQTTVQTLNVHEFESLLMRVKS